MAEIITMKWEGKVKANIRGATADQSWSLLQDFCGLHKWVPTIHTCYKLQGADGVPGCVRYCAGPVNRSSTRAAEAVGWSKEKLLTFDPVQRTYSYEIVETNKGFGRYVATIKVVPCCSGGGEGCVLEWSFMADPVMGWTQEGFVSFLGELAEATAKKIGKAFADLN